VRKNSFVAALAAITLGFGGAVAVVSPASASGIVPIVKSAPSVPGEPAAAPESDKAKPPVLSADERKSLEAKAAKANGVKANKAKNAPPAPAHPGYWYAGGYQYVESDGAYVNCNVHKPFLHTEDAHSLCELAVQSADGNQTVEIGWTVDRGVNSGSDDPHLFAYHWVNGQQTCYNACGFVDYTSSLDAGDLLALTASGANFRMGITRGADEWWLSVDEGNGAGGVWVGYFPDSLWENASTPVTFEKAGLIQAFGEIATTTNDIPCTDMGNGELGNSANTAAARLGTFNLSNPTGGASPSLTVRTQAYHNSTTGPYNVEANTATTLRFGGFGYNSVSELPGSKGSCAPGAEGVPAASSLQVWKEACPDGAAVTGCNSAWSVPWSTAVVNQCHAVTGVNDDWRRVWNNSLSSGKAFYVYATTTCGSTRQLVTNASKVVTPWDIHGWARAS
jgi:hypothetical protein